MKGWDQWRDVYSAEGQLLFAGLRAKVSVFHGQMTRIVPHTTTGTPSQHPSASWSVLVHTTYTGCIMSLAWT